MNGADVLISVNTGTEAVPVWTAVGSQKDASLEETSEEIDVSNKTSRNKRVLAGRYSASVSLEALYVSDDTGYSALRTAMRYGDLVQIARTVITSGVPAQTEKADAIITSLSEAFPDQDGATVSISLTISGGWVAI